MAGRRKKKRKKRDAPGVPVNSFADIAFLLIVFFVIASTLTRTTGVISDIPAGEKSEARARLRRRVRGGRFAAVASRTGAGRVPLPFIARPSFCGTASGRSPPRCSG